MVTGLYFAAGFLLFSSLRKFYRRHYRRGISYFLLAIVFAAAGFSYQRIYLHLQTYDVIHEERDIAEVVMQSIGNQQEVVIRDLVRSRSYRWQPKGQQWQLQLRLVQLKGSCTALGWPDFYRLARLQAQDSDTQQHNGGTVHSVQLQQQEQGWDLWRFARKLSKQRPDLAETINNCITTEVLTSEAQPFVKNRRYRFSFRSGQLQIRQLPGAATN